MSVDNRKEGKMTENTEPEANVEEEFQRLGENLKNNIKAAWESPQSQETRREISEGLQQLGDTLNQLIQDFKEGPTAKRVQTEVEEFSERVRTGEVEAKMKSELVKVLNVINVELEKVTESLQPEPPEDPQAEDSA
jgi:hypothetical protein